jgi:hypothetical protein
MNWQHFPLWGSVLATFAAAGAAQSQPRVAIVSAAAGGAAAALVNNLDVRNKLIGTGFFQQVDILDVAEHAGYTPTLAELAVYDAVITWSNSSYFNATELGNVLADYVDSGGGVVVAVFAHTTTMPSRRLDGRWRVGGDYEIIRSGYHYLVGPASLGWIAVPGHPIMAGVSFFDGGPLSYRPNSIALSPHGQLISHWSDGRILVAVSSQYPNRADLGLFPPSSDVNSDWWVSSSHGGRLMANALLYTIQSGPSCYPNCDGSTQEPILNVADFSCFLSKFAAGDPYANCDGSTQQPVLNVADFSCFLGKFAAGCP